MRQSWLELEIAQHDLRVVEKRLEMMNELEEGSLGTDADKAWFTDPDVATPPK